MLMLDKEVQSLVPITMGAVVLLGKDMLQMVAVVNHVICLHLHSDVSQEHRFTDLYAVLRGCTCGGGACSERKTERPAA